MQEVGRGMDGERGRVRNPVIYCPEGKGKIFSGHGAEVQVKLQGIVKK